MNDLSQFAQSNYLLKYLNYDSGFFIEAGANDGLKFSNTYLFESEKNGKDFWLSQITISILNVKRTGRIQ